MRVALAQIEIEAAAVSANVDRAVEAVETAAANGADLVALPEIFNVGYFAFDSYAREAEPLDGPTLTRLAEAAATNDVGVLAGSIVEDLAATDDGPAAAESGGRSADEDGDAGESGGLANTSVLLDRDGERRAVYRKHHLFGYESAEARMLVPGESLGVADFGGHTVGMTTCYDLRFPELYRSLVDEGVTLVLVPSAWPYPRVEHWKTLPRARAIENLCYVGTINGAAEFEDAALVGRSTLFDPWGTPVATTDDDPDVVYGEADPERVAAVREDFPALRDRRR